jgi:hypothetical protein
MERSIVGDLINFRGLVYSPTNEQGVVFLFGKVAADLNMYVEEIKPGFPDCIGRRFIGKGWERIAIEFEFASCGFRDHRHDHTKCDVIVCWEHNWPDCPVEVVELREVIKTLQNDPVVPPVSAQAVHDLSDVMDRRKVDPRARELFARFDAEARGLDDRIFGKVTKNGVTYYCPERAFAAVQFRTDHLFVEFFTGGQRDPDVQSFSASPQWGHLRVRDDRSRARTLELVRASLSDVRDAVKHNRPTAYTTPAEEADDEPDGPGSDVT